MARVCSPDLSPLNQRPKPFTPSQRMTDRQRKQGNSETEQQNQANLLRWHVVFAEAFQQCQDPGTRLWLAAGPYLSQLNYRRVRSDLWAEFSWFRPRQGGGGVRGVWKGEVKVGAWLEFAYCSMVGSQWPYHSGVSGLWGYTLGEWRVGWLSGSHCEVLRCERLAKGSVCVLQGLRGWRPMAFQPPRSLSDLLTFTWSQHTAERGMEDPLERRPEHKQSSVRRRSMGGRGDGWMDIRRATDRVCINDSVYALLLSEVIQRNERHQCLILCVYMIINI